MNIRPSCNLPQQSQLCQLCWHPCQPAVPLKAWRGRLGIGHGQQPPLPVPLAVQPPHGAPLAGLQTGPEQGEEGNQSACSQIVSFRSKSSSEASAACIRACLQIQVIIFQMYTKQCEVRKPNLEGSRPEALPAYLRLEAQAWVQEPPLPQSGSSPDLWQRGSQLRRAAQPLWWLWARQLRRRPLRRQRAALG